MNFNVICVGNGLSRSLAFQNPIKIKCDCSPKAFAKKVISAPSFRLGGKGWYETDFKTGSKKNLVQSDKKDKKTTETPKKKENKEK